MRRRSFGTFQPAMRSTSRPSMKTRPKVGRFSRRTSRRKVDLPEPEAPTRNTNSPFSTSTDTSSRAARCCPGYVMVTFSKLITTPHANRGIPLPEEAAPGRRLVLGRLVGAPAPPDPGLEEPVDVAVEDRRRVAGLVLCAQVLD